MCRIPAPLQFGDVRIAFGESDEYSFVFYKNTQVYGEWQGVSCALEAPPALLTCMHKPCPDQGENLPGRPEVFQAGVAGDVLLYWELCALLGTILPVYTAAAHPHV